MNPFVSRISNSSPVVPISAMGLLLGVMISLAWITNDQRTSVRSSDPEQKERLALGTADQQQKIAKQQEEIAKLRSDLTAAQNAMAGETKQSEVLNKNLQELKQFAGLTPVMGPGIVVTLSDLRDDKRIDAIASELIIHDRDVLKVVNELWNGGAEAISVNGNRVTVSTSFRCVGSTILVDTTRIASPIVIQAIGDPSSLEGAMKLPEGIYDELRSVDARMIKIEQAQKMQLPSYNGSTRQKFAKTVPEKASSGDGE